MNIDINAVAVKAVMDAMGEPEREKLIEEVLSTMLTKKEPDSFGSRNNGTLFENALRRAAGNAVEKYCEQYFAEHDAQLRDFVAKTIGDLMEREEFRKSLTEAIAAQIDRGIRGY